MDTIKKIIPSVCWLIATFILGFLASKWSLFWDHLEYGQCYCYFIGYRMEDFLSVPLPALKEEVIYRFVPFLVATTLVMIIKQPKAKKVVIALCIMAIIMVQLYFGYKHFHPECGDTNYWFFVRLQGGLGIILACIYGVMFWLSMKKFYPKSKHHILTFLLCHILAILTTTIIHSISNCLIIVNYTF